MHSSANCWNRKNNPHHPDCQQSGQPPPVLHACVLCLAQLGCFNSTWEAKTSCISPNTTAGLFKQHDIEEIVIISTPPASRGVGYWMSFRGQPQRVPSPAGSDLPATCICCKWASGARLFLGMLGRNLGLILSSWVGLSLHKKWCRFVRGRRRDCCCGTYYPQGAFWPITGENMEVGRRDASLFTCLGKREDMLSALTCCLLFISPFLPNLAEIKADLHK